MKEFESRPGLKRALAYRLSPPLRRGSPDQAPKGGKEAQDTTLRQQIFTQAVWDIAEQTGNGPFPSRFVLDDEGQVYFDQGCIDMAKDWLHCKYAKSGWPVALRIEPAVWAAGRPPMPEAA